MVRARWAGAATAFVAIFASSAVWAQELRVGRDVRGELRRGDATHQYGAFEDVYTLNGQAGQTLTITSEARELTTYVRITGPNNFSSEGLTVNYRAAIYVALPESGAYQVFVRGPYGDARGRYTLRAVAADAATLAVTAPATPLALGAALNGALQTDDPHHTNGVNGDAYEFVGAAGQQVEFRMRSEEFNTLLSITGPNGFQAANNYDRLWGRPMRNARLAVTLPAAGAYRVVATTSEEEAKTGAYILDVVSEEQAVQDRAARVATAPSVLARADNYLNAGDNNNAIAYYEFGLRLTPENALAMNNLGVAYLRSNNPTMAELYFSNALRLSPDHEHAGPNLRLARQRIAENQAAEQRQREEQARQRAAYEAERRRREAQEAQAWGRIITGVAVAAAGGNANQVNQALNGQVTPRQAPPPQTGTGGGASTGQCGLDGFSAQFRQLSSSQPINQSWGSRDTFQYSFFLGTRGLEYLESHRACMSSADYQANRQALEGMRDQGRTGCEQLSTSAGSCRPVYPGG